MLTDVMLSVHIMLSVFMLSDVILSIVILSVVILSVVAPLICSHNFVKNETIWQMQMPTWDCCSHLGPLLLFSPIHDIK
jgi:hypothetical protein